MKRVALILLILSIFLSIHAQQQRLKKGEVFTIAESRLKLSDEIRLSNILENKKEEGFFKREIRYTIFDVKNDRYIIKADFLGKEYYSRRYRNKTGYWQSSISSYPELKKIEESKKLPKNFLSIQFELLYNGEIANVKFLDKSSRGLANVLTKVLKLRFICPIIMYDDALIKGEEYQYNNDVITFVKSIGSHNIFSKKIETEDSIKHEKLLFSSINGVLQELQQYIVVKDSATDKTIINYELKRAVSKRIGGKSFKCKYIVEEFKKDTVFNNVNTIIKGEVLNPIDKRSISISWSESSFAAIDRVKVEVPLGNDNTFEFKLRLKDIKHITLRYKDEVNLSLLPEDSIHITFDTNRFYETLHADGIGSANANYFFDKFIFQKKENLFNNSISRGPVKFEEYSLGSFKNKVLNFIKRRKDFLDQYKSTLSPEIFLSEYYNPNIAAINVFMQFKTFEQYYSDLAGTTKLSPNRYEFVSDLIHPDNDLMCFTYNSDRVINKFVFSFLDTKVNLLVGKASVIPGHKNHDRNFTLTNRYNLCHSYFDGKIEYLLKYRIVKEALERNAKIAANDLYDRFIKEYTNSPKSYLLTNLFTKYKNSRVGRTPYNICAKNYDGNKVKLSDLKGKAVFIDIVDKQNMELLMKYDKKLDSLQNLYHDVAFVLISMEHDDSIMNRNMYNLNYGDIKLFPNKEEIRLIKENLYLHGILNKILIDANGKIFKRDFSGYLVSILNKDPDLLINASKVNKRRVTPEHTIRILKITLSIIALLLIIGFVAWGVYRRRTKRKIQESAINTKVRELELTAIRAQMNPHFMYNCLNSIQNLVQKKQNDEAHQYLSRFAQLIRSVLNNSDKEEISLATELGIINNYLELEQLRFEIKYSVSMDETLDAYSIFLPPLILQPLVENAIIHGLAPKQNDRVLDIHIESIHNNICISVIDNGVGRKASEDIEKTSSGKGIGFSRERLNLLSEKYGTDYKMEIEDLKDAKNEAIGTKVQICFPEE